MKKLIILFIAFSVFISAVSCKTKESLPAARETVLQVEESECVYSDTEKAELSVQILEILDKASQISDSEREYIATYVNDSFFDKLQSIPIYEKELYEILRISDEVLDSAPENSILGIYTKLGALLGNDRCCKLMFEGFVMLLSRGGESTSGLLRILTEDLGQKTFSEILSVFMFCASVSSGVLPTGSDSVSVVNDAELLMLLKRQASYYLSLEITPEQWSLAATLFEESGVTDKSHEKIFPSVISSLSSSGFFTDAAMAMPRFLSLYAAAVNSLTADDISALRAESSNKLQLVCRALSQAEGEFSAFTEALLKNASTDMNAGYGEIKSLGYEQQYLDFIDNMAYSAPPALYEAIKAYGTAPSVSAYGELNRSMLFYVFKLSPSLSFALEHKLAEGF